MRLTSMPVANMTKPVQFGEIRFADMYKTGLKPRDLWKQTGRVVADSAIAGAGAGTVAGGVAFDLWHPWGMVAGSTAGAVLGLIGLGRGGAYLTSLKSHETKSRPLSTKDQPFIALCQAESGVLSAQIAKAFYNTKAARTLELIWNWNPDEEKNKKFDLTEPAEIYALARASAIALHGKTPVNPVAVDQLQVAILRAMIASPSRIVHLQQYVSPTKKGFVYEPPEDGHSLLESPSFQGIVKQVEQETQARLQRIQQLSVFTEKLEEFNTSMLLELDRLKAEKGVETMRFDGSTVAIDTSPMQADSTVEFEGFQEATKVLIGALKKYIDSLDGYQEIGSQQTADLLEGLATFRKQGRELGIQGRAVLDSLAFELGEAMLAPVNVSLALIEELN